MTQCSHSDPVNWLHASDEIELRQLFSGADEPGRSRVGKAVHLRGLIAISNARLESDRAAGSASRHVYRTEAPMGDNMDITICLGSSCFARGNGENLRVLQEYIKQNGLSVTIRMRGVLCHEKCTAGPNIMIEGIEYTDVQPGTAVALLERAMMEKRPA
jgi:(2Fe-2S) ferredoxin